MAFVSWPLILDGYEFSKTKQGQILSVMERTNLDPQKFQRLIKLCGNTIYTIEKICKNIYMQTGVLLCLTSYCHIENILSSFPILLSLVLLTK